MPQITVPQLERLLCGLRQSTIASIYAATVPAMRKEGNPFICDCGCNLPLVRKLTYTQGVLYWDYQRAVNRQRAREENGEWFAQDRRPWGRHKRQPGNPLAPKTQVTVGAEPPAKANTPSAVVEHDGKTYLHFKQERVIKATYRICDREPIASEMRLIESLLIQPPPPANQQVARVVVVRDYALANIRQIRLLGFVYDIKTPTKRKRA